MNGPVEQAGKAANSFIQALKDQPLVLALCVMNVGLLGIGYFFLTKVYEQRQLDQAALYREHQQTQDILKSCVHVDDLEKLMKR